MEYIVPITWIGLISFTMAIYYIAVGFSTTFTFILGIILFIVVIMNLVLSSMEMDGTPDMQESVMELIESNAKAFLPFGIALAALVIAAGRVEDVLKKRDFLIQLLVATGCFTYVLVVIWIPTYKQSITRFMRESKTAILALGGAMVVSLVGTFVLGHMEDI